MTIALERLVKSSSKLAKIVFLNNTSVEDIFETIKQTVIPDFFVTGLPELKCGKKIWPNIDSGRFSSTTCMWYEKYNKMISLNRFSRIFLIGWLKYVFSSKLSFLNKSAVKEHYLWSNTGSFTYVGWFSFLEVCTVVENPVFFLP